MNRIHLRMAALGLAFGFAFSCLGFTDFAEVHKMFTFADLRLFLTFCGGVALSMVGFFLLARKKRLRNLPRSIPTVAGPSYEAPSPLENSSQVFRLILQT